MKYKVGQKVRIKRKIPDFHKHVSASRLDPPFVAIISKIVFDSDIDQYQPMYLFKGSQYGYFEDELEGLYDREIIKYENEACYTCKKSIHIDYDKVKIEEENVRYFCSKDCFTLYVIKGEHPDNTGAFICSQKDIPISNRFEILDL